MGKRIPVRQRALANTVIRENGCVEWTGGQFKGGYGRISVDGRGKRAHRVIYELLVGPIPEGLEPDHLCRNKLCVAPADLEIVTPRVNILRSDGPGAMNARKTHCVNGHPFDEANTGARADAPNGGRRCRHCAVEATQRYLKRKKET